jgi:hypothetical protein
VHSDRFQDCLDRRVLAVGVPAPPKPAAPTANRSSTATPHPPSALPDRQANE